MLAGADVNQTVGNGGTPLMTASWHCDDETASLLLKRGAHVNAQDLAGYSALMQATQMCSDGTVISMPFARWGQCERACHRREYSSHSCGLLWERIRSKGTCRGRS